VESTPDAWTLLGPSRGARRLRAALLGLAAGALLLVRSPHPPCVDFCTYYAAGRLAAAGEAARAYDGAALAAAHANLHEGTRRIGGYLYSPLFLPAAAALASLPFAAAEALHRIAGALLLGAGLGCVLLRLGDPRLEGALAAAFLLSHTAWTQLVFQNWGIALFAALALALLAAERGRSATAALAWAVAGHLKVFAALVAAPLVATRWRRQVLGAAGAAVALALATLPWVGLDAWRAWLGTLGEFSARGVTPFYNKVSLAAGIARFTVDPRAWLAPREPAAELLTRVLPWVGMALLALAAVRLRRDPERLAAAAIAIVLLAVPQVWDHTEILLFVALPALPRRAIWAFAALLALSAGYGALVGQGLESVLRGRLAPAPVALLLFSYPATNLALLAVTLFAGPRPERATDA